MKTTTLILTAAVVVGSALIGCSKKDNGDDQKFSVSTSAVTVEAGKVETFRVTAKSTKVKSDNESIAKADAIDGTILVKVTGVKEGKTNVTITEGSNRAIVQVTVTPQKNNNPSAVLQVDNSILFLQRGVEVEITNRVIKSSGSITIQAPNTAVATVRQAGNNLFVKGVGEGVSGDIRIKDNGSNEEISIPVYVIVPFKAPTLPAQITVGDNQTVALTGVYNTNIVENGRYDRVKVTSNNGKADITLVTEDVKNNVGQKTGEKVTGFTITGKNAGTAAITLTNGDGQTLNLSFEVVNFTANTYFNVDANGVLTVKPGVTLPTKVVLPSNAKKVAAGAFVGQLNVQEINFNNVTEIEGKLFTSRRDNVAPLVNVTTIIMPNVKIIGDSAFRNAKKLTKVEFPATLTHLGQYAFSSCSALQHVAFRGNLPKGLGPITATLVNGKYEDPEEHDKYLAQVFTLGPGVRYLYINNPEGLENGTPRKRIFKDKFGESNFRAGSAESVKDISEFR